MIAQKDYQSVQRELEGHLRKRLNRVSVRIGEGIHYRGVNVVVTWSGFAGLLPEQRFHHVVRAIPGEYYDRHLREGIVWFELAPGESAEAYMRMPRSEDVAAEEGRIAERLRQMGFWEEFLAAAGLRPHEASADGFVESGRILREAGEDEEAVRKACLFFIRQGAYCDAHLLAEGLSDQSGLGRIRKTG